MKIHGDGLAVSIRAANQENAPTAPLGVANAYVAVSIQSQEIDSVR
jgi:hypothetical protein